MTAPSKAARFADAAEAAGWTVERRKYATEYGEGRHVVARRGAETYSMQWYRTEAGSFLFDQGWHRVEGREDDEPANNVAAVLRAMQTPEAHVRKMEWQDSDGDSAVTVIIRLPFDPASTPDAEVIEAVKGKRITWINSLTGAEEEARIPPYTTHSNPPLHVEGKSTKIRTVTRRVLEFASEEGTRSVALDAIVKVRK